MGSVKKSIGCMGVILLCILLFVVGVSVVLSAITLSAHYLL